MKKLATLLISFLLVMGLTVGSQASPVVWFDFDKDKNPDTYWKLMPSEIIWVDIYVSGIPAPGLVSMGLIVNYDPNQLEVTPGTDINWTNWYLGPGVALSTGVIDMKGGRLSGLSGDNIHLGVIELHCKATGISQLTMTDHVPPYDDFVLADKTVLDGSVQFASATIENVPVPATLLLLGPGIIGLLGLRRRLFSS